MHVKKIICPDSLKISSAEQCLFIGDPFFICFCLQVWFYWLLITNGRSFSKHY